MIRACATGRRSDYADLYSNEAFERTVNDGQARGPGRKKHAVLLICITKQPSYQYSDVRTNLDCSWKTISFIIRQQIYEEHQERQIAIKSAQGGPQRCSGPRAKNMRLLKEVVAGCFTKKSSNVYNGNRGTAYSCYLCSV